MVTNASCSRSSGQNYSMRWRHSASNWRRLLSTFSTPCRRSAYTGSFTRNFIARKGRRTRCLLVINYSIWLPRYHVYVTGCNRMFCRWMATMRAHSCGWIRLCHLLNVGDGIWRNRRCIQRHSQRGICQCRLGGRCHRQHIVYFVRDDATQFVDVTRLNTPQKHVYATGQVINLLLQQSNSYN